MDIIYPSFLENLLNDDRNLRSGVDAAAEDFRAWFETSKLPFFPDYTDHGVEHLNCVLSTASSLITDEGKCIFTPGDAAALILATLHHDSAMHISEAGFRELVNGSASSWKVEGFGDTPWPALWSDYLFSAKRWDDRMLANVLGDDIADEQGFAVTDPFLHYDDLKTSDRKIIGEFIRRHHPRMAHEFAVFGIPGPEVLRPNSRIGPDVWDIVGLIARSHGLPVRAALDYLQTKYHRREYQGIHAVFLMALLRVSDYVQIQSSRAPSIVFRYRHIPSRVSVTEWKAHNAVKNITNTHDDPESLEIQAQPNDVKTFLRLKDWLAGIQQELDASWAVLGEVYGSHDSLARLGLILRRVRSNLDDIHSFAASVQYVPQRIELEVARPDLLKLLVRPLYNNIPSIGIRELIQNAVDAVRERRAIESRYPNLKGKDSESSHADVEVWLDSPDGNGYAWLTVSDRGIGMTVDVVRDYLFKAGASFRSSDAWKKDFEADASPRSRVLRSGRFGVGLLAGFLLGTRMEISTRYIREDRGLRFSSTLELEPIEITYDSDLRVGTTIRIQIAPEIYKQLTTQTSRVSVPAEFDWFLYSDPPVVRLLGQERQVMEQRVAIDPADLDHPSRYRRVGGIDEYAVYWSYDEHLPALSVNGLFVTDSSTLKKFWEQAAEALASIHVGRCRLEPPKIIVQDPDGVFPLNLTRTGITDRGYTFEEQLLSSIIDDFLAFLIVHCPESPAQLNWNMLAQYSGLRYPVRMWVGDLSYHLSPVFICPDGLALTMEHLNWIMQPTSLFGSFFCDRQPWWSDTHEASILLDSPYYDPQLECIPQDEYLTVCALNLATHLRSDSALSEGRRIAGIRVLVPESTARSVLSPRWASDVKASVGEPLSKSLMLTRFTDRVRKLRGLSTEHSSDGVVILSTKRCPEGRFGRKHLSRVALTGHPVCEILLSKDKIIDSYMDTHRIAKRWSEIIRSPVIPFDKAERRRRLAHAYAELEPFIQAHLSILNTGEHH